MPDILQNSSCQVSSFVGGCAQCQIYYRTALGHPRPRIVKCLMTDGTGKICTSHLGSTEQLSDISDRYRRIHQGHL